MTEIDDDEDVPCARHPKRLTALRCSNCGTPICPDCSVVAAVGLKCPDCGRLPRSARAVLPTKALVRAILAAVVLGIVGGVAFVIFRNQIGFLTLIAAYLLGIVIGEGVIRASGGFRNSALATIASLSAGLGLLAPLALTAILEPKALHGGTIIYTLIAAAIAAYSAGNRTYR